MSRWSSVLTKLERDPMDCAREIDWVAKLTLLQGYRDRDGLEWSDHRLKAIDIQWSDIRPEKGLFHRLLQRGRIERLVDDAAVEAAMTNPPEDTRAYFRGRCLDKYGSEIAAASWDSLIFDVPGQTALQRVPMLEPLRGTREGVGDLIDRSPDASALLRELAAANA
jgi:proteasome accessory factor A